MARKNHGTLLRDMVQYQKHGGGGVFGFVMPVDSELSEQERRVFRAAYCGVCFHMGRVARMGLQYDCAFLALARDAVLKPIPSCRRNCRVRWFFRKVDCAQSEQMQYAADVNTLLVYYKIADDVRDDGSWKARFALRLMRKDYERAAERQSELNKRISARLDDLNRLEREQSRDADACSDCFAQLLQTVAAPGGDAYGPLGRMFYNIGRWIYLIDALTDWEKDRKHGNFNVYSDYDTIEQAQSAASFSLWHTVSEAANAYEMLYPNETAKPVMDNVLYVSLPTRTAYALGEIDRNGQPIQKEVGTDQSI